MIQLIEIPGKDITFDTEYVKEVIPIGYGDDWANLKNIDFGVVIILIDSSRIFGTSTYCHWFGPNYSARDNFIIECNEKLWQKILR